MEQEKAGELEELEIRLLLEGVYNHYGFDFRGYAYPSLRRRLARAMKAEGALTVSSLQDRVLHNPEAMDRLLLAISVNVTSMFRDPSFFLAFRRKVVPPLRTYPFFRIWLAGCSSGEEAYSMAILLEEEGLYERCRIYATDLNEAMVERARQGIFPLSSMQEYSANYQMAAGKASLSDYFTAGYGGAIPRLSLKRNLVFAQHDLVTDGSFNLFQVILCRNVLIYFGDGLKSHVHQLLYDSLAPFGILGLGSKESLSLGPLRSRYEQTDPLEKLYRKIPATMALATA